MNTKIDVELIDPKEEYELTRLDRRFEELAALPAGWLDGDEGAPLDAVVLDRARRILADLLNFDVPRPRVFPTPIGGVQAEWTVASHEISVTFEPDGTLYAVSVNLASDGGECHLTVSTYDDSEVCIEMERGGKNYGAIYLSPMAAAFLAAKVLAAAEAIG